MNLKRFALSSTAAFIFVFLYEMLIHSFLMKGLYNNTSSVWRPDIANYAHYMLLSQVLFGLLMTLFWVKVGSLSSCKTGLQFGLLTGALLSVPMVAAHSYLPLPITISALWVPVSFGKCLGASLLIARIYKNH